MADRNLDEEAERRMRIVAGRLKGRKLIPPVGRDIRPTSGRARESIFNLLMHGKYGGESVIGRNVADLCCGTGALGLEAISRGAAHCTFIDQDKKSLALARENAVHCGVANACHFVQADVSGLPAAHVPVALVLMDAPYDTPLLAPAYASLKAQGWLEEGTLIVSELPQKAPPPVLEGAGLLDSRTYGKTAIHIYKVA